MGKIGRNELMRVVEDLKVDVFGLTARVKSLEDNQVLAFKQISVMTPDFLPASREEMSVAPPETSTPTPGEVAPVGRGPA